MNIKFVYDEKDIKDIRIIFIDIPGTDDFKETFKIFCIDSLPADLEVKATENEDGFLIESVNGERTLTEMARFLYLIFKLLELYGSEIKELIGKEDTEDFELTKLKPEIAKTEGMSYQELFGLLGANVEHDDNGESSVC